MVFNTITVCSAVAPAVLETLISHYLNHRSLAQKPTAHISYHEGLRLIRQFLLCASHHTVEEVQRFTAQWVPCPHWVKVDPVTIGEEHLTAAAEVIRAQLGHHGIEKVGGKIWWQWRRPGSELKAEWIEMRSDYLERTKQGGDAGVERIMLYVHGGAYFFGSVDEHRYQMQRHARKLKARVFARMLVTLRDRGIPLPAGAVLISPWVDLTHSFPSVSGDNPLDFIPHHGFHQRPSPSWPPPTSDDMLAAAEDAVKKLVHNHPSSHSTEKDAIQGFHGNEHPDADTKNGDADADTAINDGTGPTANTVPGSGHDLSIMLDGKIIEIKEQIQMYATNQLISHPLVSPVLQPSLGGLPPLLILTGGGEALRDEQIYLAHKAANPAKYPPGDAFLDENPHDHNRDQIERWKPTDVQLQIWDDLCHAAPTLSFTRPAKYMYRSVAQFGAWALARAQKTAIEIMDDDKVSIISESDSEHEARIEEKEDIAASNQAAKLGHIGKAGDPLPPFKKHMIRQRVDRHGCIYPLEDVSVLPACNIPPSQIGVIKEGPVRKWMAAKQEWDIKFASVKRRVQKQRAREMMEGYQTFGDGEVPPPSALAGRRRKDDQLKEEKNRRSWGMSLWSLWGSKHDKETMVREQHADKELETTAATDMEGANVRPLDDIEAKRGKSMTDQKKTTSCSRSRRRTVTDEHQTDQQDEVDENNTISDPLAIQKINEKTPQGQYLSPNSAMKKPEEDIPADAAAKEQGLENGSSEQDIPADATPKEHDFEKNTSKQAQAEPLQSTIPVIIEPETQSEASITKASQKKRPKLNGIAFPFSLKRMKSNKSLTGSNISTATLTSAIGIPPAKDVRTAAALESGLAGDKKGSQTWPRTEKALPAGATIKTVKSENEKLAKKKVEAGGTNEQRPPFESFVTADDELPLPKPGFAGLNTHHRNISQRSIRDYVTW